MECVQTVRPAVQSCNASVALALLVRQIKPKARDFTPTRLMTSKDSLIEDIEVPNTARVCAALGDGDDRAQAVDCTSLSTQIDKYVAAYQTSATFGCGKRSNPMLLLPTRAKGYTMCHRCHP